MRAAVDAVTDARTRLTRPLQSWSLTWRLIAVLVVLLVVALLLTNAVTATLMRGYLVERTNTELRVAATPVAARVFEQFRNHNRADEIPSNYEVVFTNPDASAQIATFDRGEGPDVPALKLDDPRVVHSETFTVGSQNGPGEWQVLAGRLSNGSGTYAVAASLAGVEQTVARMTVVSAAIGVVVVALCVLVGWLGFRRAFRPLRSIEDTAATIAAGDLTSRVPEHAARDEVASLSRSLNAMLAHIESSFASRKASEARMRRFVTDASHELRTPLATVRGYAELYRQGAASSPEAVTESMRRIESEATRMSGLVEDLLLLARMDNRRPLTLTDVDLTVLAGDAVQDARVRDTGHPVRLCGLDGRPLGPVVVVGDEGRLRQVVTNLLGNAFQHTPAGTSVTIAVGHLPVPGGPPWCRIEVRDTGPGIPPEAMPHVFERFYRTDPARGRHPSGGHGLGLAIVAAIVEAHGGRAGVAPTPGGGATFVVDLPPAPVRTGDAPPDVADPNPLDLPAPDPSTPNPSAAAPLTADDAPDRTPPEENR